MDYYKEKMLRREIAMKMFDADVVDKQLIELFTDAINRNNKGNQ